LAKGGLRAGAAPELAADSAAFSGEGGRSGARDIFPLYLKVCEAGEKNNNYVRKGTGYTIFTSFSVL
jgi:hypothetical protein